MTAGSNDARLLGESAVRGSHGGGGLAGQSGKPRLGRSFAQPYLSPSKDEHEDKDEHEHENENEGGWSDLEGRSCVIG